MTAFNKLSSLDLKLAATPIGYAATSAVSCTTVRIFLICVHGFTFYGEK